MPDTRDIWIRMNAILRSARQIVNAELEPLGLSGAEGDILFHLLSSIDTISQETLAERLDIGKAAISRTVASLEKKGYIHRYRLESDSRVNCVTLTTTAQEMSTHIEYAYKNVYDIALADIKEEDFSRVDQCLGIVHQNLNQWESSK